MPWKLWGIEAELLLLPPQQNSDQLHTPADLLPGKHPKHPVGESHWRLQALQFRRLCMSIWRPVRRCGRSLILVRARATRRSLSYDALGHNRLRDLRFSRWSEAMLATNLNIRKSLLPSLSVTRRLPVAWKWRVQVNRIFRKMLTDNL